MAKKPTNQKKTRSNYENFLNEEGVPEKDKYENGGFIKAKNYGTWLRINNPTKFNSGFNDWAQLGN